MLRVVAGLSAEDVARVTGRSPGAVRVLQHRALRRLADFFTRTLVTIKCLAADLGAAFVEAESSAVTRGRLLAM